MTDPVNLYNTQIGSSIREAAQWLRQNEAVGVPTETVYGLAANALNHEAVLKIYNAKNRPTFNPLILHLGSLTDLPTYASRIPDEVYQLAEYFSPGPITYLLPKNVLVPDLVTSGMDSVALRIPSHPLFRELLQELEFPLAAPSANPFGYISPTSAAHVMQGLSGKIPYILDGGQSEIGVESTIISFLNQTPEILRFGGITPEAIQQMLGKQVKMPDRSVFKPLAPGMLKSHYAPSIPLYHGSASELQKWDAPNAAVISLKGNNALNGTQYILSEGGSLEEAASKIFQLLRLVDNQEKYTRILAVRLPNHGLGFAINDRLTRASVNL